MTRVEQAVEYFNSGLNCSQSIFSAYCEQLGLDRNAALKLSHGLGAGMGRLGHVCGAVSGAYLLLGLKCGSPIPGDMEAKEKTYALVREFSKRFEERCGSTICRDLLGFDLLSTDRSVAAIKVKEVCPKMVRVAAEIIEEII